MKISKRLIIAIISGTMLFSVGMTGCGSESSTNSNSGKSSADSDTVSDKSAPESSIDEKSRTSTESSQESQKTSGEESSDQQKGWAGYWTAELGDSGTCGENAKWELHENGELVISGTGPMEDFASGHAPKQCGVNINKITIEKGITTIGKSAFYHCSRVKDVTIPDSVTSIGGSAFCKCGGVEEFRIPETVTSIGLYAFSECNSIRSIDLPKGITTISGGLFDGCDLLQSIVIPDGVTEIDDFAFHGCEHLTEITLPKSLTRIGVSAFGCCKSLTGISLPDGLKTIENIAFEYSYKLADIDIPDSVTEIGREAFSDTAWYDLQPDGVVYAGKVAYYYKGNTHTSTDIVLRDDTVGIAKSAFKSYSWITSMTVPETVVSIGFEAFEKSTKMVMYGKSGSYAETYAKKENIKFVAK